jgi:hypothetical protein
MFEMAFADGITRGMAFDGHSPGVFVTRNSSMISSKDWPRMRMALDDEELRHVDRGETAEALLALRRDIETCLSDLDLHDEVKGHFLRCLDRHIRPSEHNKKGPGPNAKLGATDMSKHAHDFDEEAFTRHLREKGLDEETIEEALEIVGGMAFDSPSHARRGVYTDAQAENA